MTYDKYTWLIDGKVSVTSSLTITPGMHTLQILLEKSGKEVSRKATTFQVNEPD